MKIVIIAGGTGSIALQEGLNEITRQIDGVDIKVLVNAYDNGLSTGIVRRVFDGKILGPSDVRKNQTTAYRLKESNDDVIKFLDHRFTSTADKAKEYCLNKIYEQRGKIYERAGLVSSAVDTFFDAPASHQVDYTDFSLCNIIYAGLAAQNGNSLRAAASIMANVLDISDNVILNDDTSLFLQAITESGRLISDEGDIVSWNTPSDPIVKIQFVDASGSPATPTLCDEAMNALMEADLIILSSGTQWSSLIPTYESVGFDIAMTMTKARVLMVMNRVPDKDAPEMSASDIVRLLKDKYFHHHLEVLIDETGHEQMNSISADVASMLNELHVFKGDTFAGDRKSVQSKHSPTKLAHAVLKAYFTRFIDARAYMFDYDDTLVGRGNTFQKSSKLNVRKIFSLDGKQKTMVAICSGNGIKSINLGVTHFDDCTDVEPNLITVFADGGINEYTYDRYKAIGDEDVKHYTFVKCLNDSSRISAKGPTSIESITQDLCAAGIPLAKIENRGDVTISIKPISPEYRDVVASFIRLLTKSTDLSVAITGRSTIEIRKNIVNKSAAIKEMLNLLGPTDKLIYVGDELTADGNDSPALELSLTDPRLVCFPVDNPDDTALLLYTLTTDIRNDNRF